MENRSALIVGATGLIGAELLRILKHHSYYQKVYVLTRRPLDISHERITEIIVNFDELKADDLPQIDDIYCCLGTTMNKAGSKEAFRKVDYYYPVKVAELGKEKGARQYLIVTALGADKKSSFFYNHVKGEVEEALFKLGYRTLHIFRPSVLLGKRNENRAGEGIAQVVMQALNPLMLGALKKYRPIEGKNVAEAMFIAAKQNLSGPHLFESEKIKVLAKSEL
ncbi:oxidoreductase [Catalinimonas sp. 4WD22]|uniref:oxidoreductase n=1 Tax=Catalinimonas locisalis TaxID=3133978 RepID=UPI0031013AF7